MKYLLTRFTKLADIRPSVFTNAFESAPKFFTAGAVFARIWIARGFAVLDDFQQMDGHVRINVQNLAVDDQTSEASNQPLADGSLF